MLGPLEREHCKELLRCLRSSVFQAPGPLLEALGHTDAAGRTSAGLVVTSAATLVPLLGSLVGATAAPGTAGAGAVGLLASKDWAVRRAAADALKCFALALGPKMEPEGAWADGHPQSLTWR